MPRYSNEKKNIRFNIILQSNKVNKLFNAILTDLESSIFLIERQKPHPMFLNHENIQKFIISKKKYHYY